MMQPLQIGWIDYGSSHRDKALAVLNLLAVPEAIDELGIGVIRDGFADVLFPGTSTIQTRAKYFFLVPYLFREIERERNLTPKILLERLARAELDLIPVLNNGATDGVIGARSGERLQRKPSSIYWNGLYTFDILHTPMRLSLDGYAKAVCMLKAEVKQLSSSGHQDKGEGTTDDEDVARDSVGTFWRAPIPPADWREHVTIELTPDEAVFLRNKIIQSPHSNKSLIAYILRNNAFHVTALPDLTALQIMLKDLPLELRMYCEMAERFANFIYGANIRYNMVLSGGQNEAANNEWEKWIQFVNDSHLIQTYDPAEPFEILKLSGRNRMRIYPFLNKWKQAVLSNRANAMDELIVAREIELKGKERAKLHNPDSFHWQDGLWLGGGRLQYRFRTAKRFIQDIQQGLGGTNA